MRIFAGLIIPLVLAGCGESDVRRAERRYDAVKDASFAERCREGRSLVDAYLDANDQQKYAVQKSISDIECQSARLGMHTDREQAILDKDPPVPTSSPTPEPSTVRSTKQSTGTNLELLDGTTKTTDEGNKRQSLCWQDYCPCDPPQGGPDKGICRQLRAGIDVDPEILSAGAMMRDARQQLEDFERTPD